MKAFIMPNLTKQNAIACTCKVLEKLKKIGIKTVMDLRFQGTFCDSSAEFLEFYLGMSQSNIVIAIGGDGTIIHSAKHAVLYDLPLLGINVGRLGFMAGLEMDELNLLNHLVIGDYIVENRMMLTCLHNSSNVVNEYLALNDIVVSNGSLSRIIDIDVACNGRYLTTYRADGVIISTPTGSTAYALSAGGPIVDPSLNCISITPICPHTLSARTILFSEDTVLSITPSPDNLHPIYVTIDGEQGAKIGVIDRLIVTKSDKKVKLINLNDKTFYEVLTNKFNTTTKINPGSNTDSGGI